jgi:AbrB family looped-hinge helix DNA binding protein
MSTVATTRMSSKGQVVIPEDIRERLGLIAGTEFVVLAQGDVVILRAITPPSPEEFDAQIAVARKAARRAGLTRSDVAAAIAKARTRRRGRQGGK